MFRTTLTPSALRRPCQSPAGRCAGRIRWSWLVVLAIVVGLAWLTNPSAERHRQAIREATRERSPLANMLGVGAITAFVSVYHPLGPVSYTTVNGKLVSWGAFGYVGVLDRNAIDAFESR